MSKLEELLKRECPDGVEYKKLINVCDIKRGERITKKDIKENGMFPIISGGQFPMGMYDKFNRDENTITIASYGSAGYVDYQTKKFWANDVCLCLYPKIKLLNKFLYYYLKFKQDFLYSKTTNAIPNHIPTDIIKELLIPLPPIEIQEEIVGILDTFTKYQDLLNRELELRKKQYEYYREKLLTFDDKIKHIPIGSLMERIKEKGKDDLTVKQVYVVSNIKGIVKTEDYHDNNIHSEDTSNYTILRQDMFAYNPSRLNIGSIGRLKTSISGLVSPMYVVFSVDKSMVDVKYFEYFIKSPKIINKIDSLKEEGARFRFDYNRWNWIDIPIPPLEEQERIVNILDKFDALCNDITKGLPAEIEMRKKQYEYYRDKLLTFKEKKK
ncbi:restriction endonuclease subunit S [Brachyspira pilosicoli]|uniref:restriction endonuclease subunit S n=1 Tax=Brachyspira pilosicoli TaxID=52584 RepID=UPI001CA59B10|nr:restriction endonuclease subunit S [Brachyspira pilosicoli]MBW5397423.1 restriction endonuclease subunit S [Brachyspira pilosicoli]